MHHMMFDVYIAVPSFERRLGDSIRSLRQDFTQQPEVYNAKIAGSNVDERMKFLDQMDALSYYHFLQMLRDNAPGSLNAFYGTCYSMLNRIFNNDRLTVYCSSAERGMILVKKALTEKSMEEVRAGMFAGLEKDYRHTIRNTRDFERRQETQYWRDFALAFCGNTEIEKWYDARKAFPCRQKRRRSSMRMTTRHLMFHWSVIRKLLSAGNGAFRLPCSSEGNILTAGSRY